MAQVMNEILTQTVSRLFKFRPQESSLKVNEIQATQPTPTQEEELEEEEAQEIVNMTLHHWIQSEGPKRLRGALKKLRLTEGMCQSNNFESYNAHELNTEKKKVKNELKEYDSAFVGYFNRNPGRADKEPMRPLYMYYQNLRKCISRREKEGYSQNATTSGAMRSAGNSRQSSVNS